MWINVLPERVLEIPGPPLLLVVYIAIIFKPICFIDTHLTFQMLIHTHLHIFRDVFVFGSISPMGALASLSEGFCDG